ncbi:MAG: hypothetical protein KKG78_06030 [Alphaproteobacteria bacterium]|nr:hypothetical protein [Alphaproteobacteria bacterium]
MAANEKAADRLRMTTSDVAAMLGLGRKATLERIKRAGIPTLPNCPANKPEYLRADVMAALFAGTEPTPATEPRKMYSVNDPDAGQLDWAAIYDAENELAALRRDEKLAASIDAARAHIAANS